MTSLAPHLGEVLQSSINHNKESGRTLMKNLLRMVIGKLVRYHGKDFEIVAVSNMTGLWRNALPPEHEGELNIKLVLHAVHRRDTPSDKLNAPSALRTLRVSTLRQNSASSFHNPQAWCAVQERRYIVSKYTVAPGALLGHLSLQLRSLVPDSDSPLPKPTGRTRQDVSRDGRQHSERPTKRHHNSRRWPSSS